MRVDRSQSGEYASPKRIRITRDVHVESLFLFSMISVNTHHASRITRMWSHGFSLRVFIKSRQMPAIDDI